MPTPYSFDIFSVRSSSRLSKLEFNNTSRCSFDIPHSFQPHSSRNIENIAAITDEDNEIIDDEKNYETMDSDISIKFK